MQKIGSLAEDGFTIKELKEIRKRFEEAGAECKLIKLHKLLDDKDDDSSLNKPDPAAVLVIRKGVEFILGEGKSDELVEEMFGLKWDSKMFSRGSVKNKIARHNLCFDKKNQKANYEAGKGTVVSYNDVPVCDRLHESLPEWFGEKAKGMKCEGNAYYDWKKCYILPHGDAERRRVIGVRLGHKFPLFYQWYLQCETVSEKKKIVLRHGDIYVISEKAVGTDWHTRKIYTLRHSAGLEETIVKHQRKKK